jgi:gluconokinase
MSRGEALTDEDRADWLEALRDHESVPPEPGKAPHLVITCSALKKAYRDLLREGSNQASNLRIRFVFLDAPEEVLVERATNRKGHYAKAALVHSQFEILERPGGEADCITVDVNKPMEETEKEVLDKVEALLKKDNTEPSAIPEGRL